MKVHSTPVCFDVSFSWVILTVLKVDMAMAAIEMPMAIKRFGRPGVEISVF